MVTSYLRTALNMLLKENRRKEVTGRRGKRSKQLLDDLKENIDYYKLRQETLEHSLWINGFRRGCEPVVILVQRENE